MRVVGLMSGTSADGIDAALVEIYGAPPSLDWKLLLHHHVDFDPALRTEILACTRPESGTVDRLCALNAHLGEEFAAAALAAIERAGFTPQQIDLIGSHGQTVWHIPGKSTLQIGEAAVIAERTGIPVVSNFRTRDIAAGGQGAPLVAYVDVLLLTHPTLTRAVQNIGGIANVTFLPAAGEPGDAFAFDTGPGNMVIDELARRATDGARPFDRDGELAMRGKVNSILLGELLTHPYLQARPPKTTGREQFGAAFTDTLCERGQALGMTPADLVATATAFTAQSIARAYREFLPRHPDEVILSGGGARNPALVGMLREALAPARTLFSDDLGIPSEAKEPLAFALLAYETWHGRSGNLPHATGARSPVVLGDITPLLPPGPPNAAALTEARNPATESIDTVPTIEMLEQINRLDGEVARAITPELSAIARAVDAIAERMQQGGRLVYVGAGTSGRLGVLDASEVPPTFSTSPDRVIALIAGGERAITHSIEGAEDDAVAGARDIQKANLSSLDALVGIAASGRTPYVLGAMEQGKKRGALVISLACNLPTPMQQLADISITPLVGPEAITGSTRLKAGTAQKLVLNMLSTGVMVRLGKTFGNLMVDVQTTNAKLKDRARRIVEQACGLSSHQAEELLADCNGETKTAIVAALGGLSPADARAALERAGSSVRAALEHSR